MKNLFYILLMSVLSFGCAKVQTGDAVIVFDVEDMSSNEVVLVCNNEIKTVALDEHGHGELVIPDIDAIYATLYSHMQLNDSRLLYVEGGDVLNVRSNGKDFYGSLEYDGEKAPVIGYLSKIKLTALPDEDYALPFDEYLKKIEAKEAEALKLMKANDLGDIGVFEKMEEGRIRYSFGTQLLMYPIGHRFYAQDMAYEPDDAYYDVIDSYIVENDLWADIDQYRNFMLEAVHVLDEESRDVTAAYPKAVAQMRFMADRFKSEKVRNVLLHYLAYAYVDRFGINDIQDMENIYRTYVTDDSLVAKFDEVCKKWNLASVGMPSPDFNGVDISGKEYTLADFRGRYVYVDVWATWCGPCRQEIPHLKALEEKYHDADIVFVSLSVDQDKTKWENMVKAENMTGIQLHIGNESTFLEAYNISGIPRFILLDKDGVIVNSDMSRPSAKETGDVLDSLKGIR